MTFKTGGLIVLLSLIPLSLTLTLRDSSCPSGKNYGSDSNLYWDLAENLLHRHALVFSPGVGYPGIGVRSQNPALIDDLCILPGYPALLVPFVRFGEGVGPYVLAYLLYVLLSLLVFALAKELFGAALSKRAFWGWFMVYQILNPTWIVQLRALAQDLAATTLVAFFLWVVVRCWQSQRVTAKNLLAIALGTGVALSVRTNLLAFIGSMLVLLALLYWRDRRPRMMALPAVGLALAVSLMGVWGLHIQHLTGRFSFGTNAGYCMYFNYMSPHVPPAAIDKEVDAMTRTFNQELERTGSGNQASIQTASAYQRSALDFIKAYPAEASKSMAQSLQATFIGRDYFWLPRLWLLRLRDLPLEPYADRPYHEQTQGLSKPAATAALFLQLLVYGVYILIPALALFLAAFFAREEPLLRFLAWSAIVFLVATGLIIGQARYRMPVEVVMYLCALWICSRSTAGRAAG